MKWRANAEHRKVRGKLSSPDEAVLHVHTVWSGGRLFRGGSRPGSLHRYSLPVGTPDRSGIARDGRNWPVDAAQRFQIAPENRSATGLVLAELEWHCVRPQAGGMDRQ